MKKKNGHYCLLVGLLLLVLLPFSLLKVAHAHRELVQMEASGDNYNAHFSENCPICHYVLSVVVSVEQQIMADLPVVLLHYLENYYAAPQLTEPVSHDLRAPPYCF